MASDPSPAEAGLNRPLVEAERSSPAPPRGGQRVGVDGPVLRVAGGEGGRLPGPSRCVAGLGQELLDVVAALTELVDHRLRHADGVGQAVHHRAPLDAEPLGEQVTEGGLVQVAAGERVGVERAAVERAPGVDHGEREVGHHDVGVQERVARSAGAMVEGGGHQPGGLDAFAPVPGHDGLSFVVPDDLVDRIPQGPPQAEPASL